jgi:magnesium transporter
MHPAKIAALLEILEAKQRAALWQQVDAALELRIEPHLNLDLLGQLAGDSSDAAMSEPTASGPGQRLPLDAVNQLEAILKALRSGKLKRVGKILQQIHPAKLAGLLEALPPTERSTVWSMVDTERAGKVLTHLHDEIRTKLALQLDLEDLVATAQHLELDDLVDLIQTLPAEVSSWSRCCLTRKTQPVV